MDFNPRESYRAKVLVGFAVVFVIGAALSAYTLTGLQDVVREERTETISNEADIQDDTIDTLLTGLRDSATATADTTRRLRGGDTVDGAVRAELNGVYTERATSKQIGAVHLVDPDSGEVLASSDTNDVGGDLTRMGYDLPSGVPNDGTVLRLRTTGDAASWVVYTRTGDGNLLVQTTPVSYVREELGSVLDESRVRIVNGDGVVVFDSTNASVLGTQHTDDAGVSSPAVSAGLNGSEGATVLSAGESATGTRVVTGYDKIDSTDWAVVSYAEPNTLFAAVGTVQRDLFVLLGGIAFALVGMGLLVLRPANREVDRLTEAVAALEDGELDRSVETDRADEFGDLARGLDAMRTELRDRVEDAEQARSQAEAAKQEAEALSTHLETKAETYRDALTAMADGDFTVRVDPESRHEGMQTVGETLNEVAGDLEETIADVQEFADDVADSMELLTASADQIEQSSADVAETIQSISSGAKDQRGRLQSVAGEMNDMSATVEEIASTSSEVAGSANSAAELSREGRDAAEDAADALDEIETVTDEAVAEVEELVEQVSQIQEFADVIGDIAEQTDMLALNANIEAARTDTDADGFAVVADEIKSLATEAGQRAEDIEELVGDVSEQTNATASRMQTAKQRLRESNDTVEAAIEALIDIGDMIEETNQGVQDINRATDDQAATTEEVTATVEEVEEIAATNASEANQAAAAAEEQTATVSEVARTADEVVEEANTLRETVEQFDVAPEVEKTPGEDPDETDGTGDESPDGPTPEAEGGNQPAAADGGAPDEN